MRSIWAVYDGSSTLMICTERFLCCKISTVCKSWLCLNTIRERLRRLHYLLSKVVHQLQRSNFNQQTQVFRSVCLKVLLDRCAQGNINNNIVPPFAWFFTYQLAKKTNLIYRVRLLAKLALTKKILLLQYNIFCLIWFLYIQFSASCSCRSSLNIYS